MIEPEDRWDVWDPPACEVLMGGSVTDLLPPEVIPQELPRSRPAGFTVTHD